MAGKLPNRPKCPTHPFALLQRDGTCLLCEGERLAGVDEERAKKRAMRFNFRGGRKRKAPVEGDSYDPDFDAEAENELDRELMHA